MEAKTPLPTRRRALWISAAVFASGLVLVGSLLLMSVLTNAPPRVVVAQSVGFGFTAMMGLYGTWTIRRLLDTRERAQTAALEALDRLTESEQRRVHAELKRTEMERLALVGQLASGVAHEVNNPLAFVKANLSFLEEELVERQAGLDREELRSVLEETQQGVLRIQQIVTDLRQFSRQAAPGEECAVAEAVDEARRMALVRLHSLGEVVRELPEGLPRVRVGQRHLVQVLLNLLVNAADSIESAEPRRPARIVLRARPYADGVRLEVEDNGPGIPQHVMPHLFQPFFTTKPPEKGTGLGLALCREYIVRAGGGLSAENREEGGARFIIQLPRATEPPPSA